MFSCTSHRCLFPFALLVWLKRHGTQLREQDQLGALFEEALMHTNTCLFRLIAASWLVGLLLPPLVQAQAPSIQFFMPDGSLPPREIRFTMAIDNGRIETFFTDSKGKFLLTRLLGLNPTAEYRITVPGDGGSFDTTTYSFKEYGAVYYITIYLKPLRSRAVAPAKVIDLAEVDVKVPEEATSAYAGAMRSFKEGQREEAIRGLQRA